MNNEILKKIYNKNTIYCNKNKEKLKRNFNSYKCQIKQKNKI